MSDNFIRAILCAIAISACLFVWLVFPTKTDIATMAVRSNNLARLKWILPKLDLESPVFEGEYDPERGFTMLHVAAQEANADTVKTVLQHGGNPCLRDNRGRTPLHVAINRDGEKPDELEILELLCNNKNALEIADNLGATPLHFSSMLGALNCSKLLIQQGAIVDSRDSENRTPLHESICEKNWRLARLLLENGANPSLRDRQNRSPFDYASEAELSNWLGDYSASTAGD